VLPRSGALQSSEVFPEYQPECRSWPRVQAGLDLHEGASAKPDAREDVEPCLEIKVAEINISALALLSLVLVLFVAARVIGGRRKARP